MCCPFCAPTVDEVILRDGPCYAMWTGELPEGSAMVLPVAHRSTVFDLDDGEWAATLRLLRAVKVTVTEHYHPAGWNVGWNVFPAGGQSVLHAHCHLIPRYVDEPFVGKGLRWWFKSAANRRPEPTQP